MKFWVRPETEQSGAAGRRVEQQRDQLAVRLSQQQQPEQREQQYRVSLCEVDSRGSRATGFSGRNTQIHGSPWRPSRKPTGCSLFSPAKTERTNTRAARGLVTAGSPAANVLAPVAQRFVLLLILMMAIAGRAEVGIGLSSLFNVDTRWGFGTSSGVSGFFTVNTRFSGSAGEAASGLFTVDTVGATIGNATLAGYVTDANGAALSGAVVSVLQTSVVRGQAGSNPSGYYQINSLPAGTYQVRAEKLNYLTGMRYGVNLSPSQTEIEHFALAGKPPGPVVQTVTRPAESANLPTVPGPQLKVFANGAFGVGGSFDPAKPTVILTHGWNSDPTVWAEDMAKKMIAGGANANILAWDWWQEANQALSKATTATPREGTKLGQTLATTFTSAYNQGVHFIGHSLGTLVNATAANYLHEQTGGVFNWLPSKTQMTLLDDAEEANLVSSAEYVLPIPRQHAWIDNYVSLFGLYHPEAVNVWLVKSPYYGDSSDPITLAKSVHGYACRWYGYTAATPSQSLLGNRYSFEQLGSGAQFPSPNPYPVGAVFSQDILSSQELALKRLLTVEELRAATAVWAVGLVGFGLQSPVNFASGVAQKVGSVVVNVVESLIPDAPLRIIGTGVGTPTYYTPFGMVEIPAWSLGVNLSSTPLLPSLVVRNLVRSGAGPQPTGGSQLNGEPPRVWIPVAVPTNAALFCFDFTLTGGPGEDLLSANIGGTNVFALEAKFMPTNTTLNSGPIDVSQWAGQTVEFFFGLLGCTTTNANLSLSGMRFYQVAAPALTIEIVGDEILVSWPATVQGYELQSTPKLSATNQWSAVTNVPALIGLQHVVTNSISSDSKFYRLGK